MLLIFGSFYFLFIEVEKPLREYAIIPDLPENYIVVVEEANLNDLVNNKDALLSPKKNFAEIKDPLKFFQTTRTELALIDRLGRIINSSVRGVISQYYLNDLLSETRNKIMAEILINVKEDEKNFGIEIVDLRLKRT